MLTTYNDHMHGVNNCPASTAIRRCEIIMPHFSRCGSTKSSEPLCKLLHAVELCVRQKAFLKNLFVAIDGAVQNVINWLKLCPLSERLLGMKTKSLKD